MDFKVGDIVKWCWSVTHQNTYEIVEITNNGVILKQNFGRGLVLNGRVPVSELNLPHTISDNRDSILSSIL